ncbi:hydroxyethylthiazole kinase [Amphibacillus indicireducens]|uniref:Hydroxyethylthiazole kinase n=1 Tax=Amphibacillus indicireducens TaxID=1076330 RepID=A0ABP7VMG8_9BACI
MKQSIIEIVDQVKQKQSLIHNITNQVVMNFTANGLYALGALPIMAHERREVAEITTQSDALVLNIGTLTEELLETMIVAGRAANRKGIPIVFDPVGVGATKFRTEAARKLLSELEINLIRGNTAEISHLAGLKADMRGVDATEQLDGEIVIRQSIEKLAIPIVMTGKTDFIADQATIIKLTNGSALLTKITGAGCLLSSVVAAFLAANQSNILAPTAAVAYFTIAAEKAAEQATLSGQFHIAFLDALSGVTATDLEERLQIEKVSVNGSEF